MKVCQGVREEIKKVGAGAGFGCLLALLTVQICVRVLRRTLI